MVKSFNFPACALLFPLITKITPVALIEIMFHFNKQKLFLFLFFFFSNYTIFYFIISSGTICSEPLFFSEDDFVDLFVPPDNTYVQHICIAKQLLTSFCHYILFSCITVISGFQPTSFINIQRSLVTYPSGSSFASTSFIMFAPKRLICVKLMCDAIVRDNE